jgi:hypothetical protein
VAPDWIATQQAEIVLAGATSIASSMNKRLLFLISCVACLAAWVVYRPSWFERTFDDHLARFPLAASMASRDPGLREIFLRRTEAAFNGGGWVAANKALQMSLATEVEVYADDEHINAITRAESVLLRDLENKPLACRAFLFAGGMADNLLQAQPDDTLVWSAHRAAMENGFERRMNGIRWTQPGDQETIDVMRYLSQGPVAALTGAELKATAQYLDGDPGLACSAAIKKSRNLMAMPDGDAARASRSLMANTARIDIVKVISRICRELNDGWSCA